MVEYVVPVHGAHIAYAEPVTTIGHSPARQLEQPIRAPDVASTVITAGTPHAEHSNPKGEYVAPTQSTHAVRSTFGS